MMFKHAFLEKSSVWISVSSHEFILGSGFGQDHRLTGHKAICLTNVSPKIGDIVKISSTRPISKTKRWRVSEIVRESVKIG